MTDTTEEMTETREGKTEVRDQRSGDRGRKTEDGGQRRQEISGHQESSSENRRPTVALLTGGSDRPYVLGLVGALTSGKVSVDVIGSDELSLPELVLNSRVNFLNLRGDQSPGAAVGQKFARVLTYYCRLLCYAATAKPKLFHVLWNNKFELFDRTLLLMYYKAMRRRIVLTAHNVNIRRRDGTDTWLNRLSLKTQYHLVDRIFVHTDRMKQELVSEFHVPETKIAVIPFGINSTSPETALSCAEAKARLGLPRTAKIMLAFGQIAPYKGLEYLVEAFSDLSQQDSSYRLVIAGKPKWNDSYWREIEQLIINRGVGDRVIRRIGHVPDEETETYFKAADVLVLPYVAIFQSGLIVLSYNFGLPVIAADVGSLKESIAEGRTGYIFEPRNSSDLARKIERYFESKLFANLATLRADIKAYANERYSWGKVASITTDIYSGLLRR